MNKLFSFITKNEAHGFIRLAAKVFRVLYIISSFAVAIYFIIVGVSTGDAASFIVAFFVAILVFCISMFIGMYVEAMLVGFANIFENQFEELVLKNKSEDAKGDFYLNRKQKANFEKLDKFNELRKSGAITEEEYEAKKKEYLNAL